jgi:hypothetical protein
MSLSAIRVRLSLRVDHETFILHAISNVIWGTPMRKASDFTSPRFDFLARHLFRALIASFVAPIFIASISPASACPNLSGTFLCPGWQTQPPQKMLVTTIFKPDGSATYQHRYVAARKDKTEESNASLRGIRSSGGDFNSCTTKELIHRTASEAGLGTINFINADGNYEASNGGKTQIICIRQ